MSSSAVEFVDLSCRISSFLMDSKGTYCVRVFCPLLTCYQSLTSTTQVSFSFCHCLCFCNPWMFWGHILKAKIPVWYCMCGWQKCAKKGTKNWFQLVHMTNYSHHRTPEHGQFVFLPLCSLHCQLQPCMNCTFDVRIHKILQDGVTVFKPFAILAPFCIILAG